MKILQIGAGSMGTRRLRDLHQRRGVSVALYDSRDDRRTRASEQFGVQVFSRLDHALKWEPDVLVVSTPPGTKAPYIKLALERGLHHFIESDIWSYGQPEIERISLKEQLVSAVSSSFTFLPLVKQLGPLVHENLGRLLNYQACMATYMPSWHPGEGLEYYAHHRNTAPSREMIVFELHWLNAIFSPATEVSGRFEKYGDLPGDAEDTWSLSMRLANGGVGQITITMACPQDYRRGACFGTMGMITWDIYGGDITVQSIKGKAPRRLNCGAMVEVLEAAYHEEINTFIEACLGNTSWTHTYRLSQQSSAILAAAEENHVRGTWTRVDPNVEPKTELPRKK